MARVSSFRGVAGFYDLLVTKTQDPEEKKTMRECWRASLKYNGVIEVGEGANGNEAESCVVQRQRRILEEAIERMFDKLIDRTVVMRKEHFPGGKVDFGLLQELSSVGWVVEEGDEIIIRAPFLIKEMLS